MHDNLDLILTLTSGLTAALFFGYLTHRIGLSPILGYLVAGVVVGPRTPGFAANLDIAKQLAEVGVILLMFGVGLHFHFKELLAVRRVAVPGAIGQSLVATLLGCLVARLSGWSYSEGMLFGMAISVASTVVLLRVLSDNNDLHTPAGHIAVGWLIVEDLFTVLALVILPAVFRPVDAPEQSLVLAVLMSGVRVGLLILVVVFGAGRLIPWLLGHMAATRSRELFTLTVLVLALGIAVGAAKFFGVSMALGAFLAGMVVGRSEFSLRAAAEALPMRDAFAVLFFVSVGMLFDPRYLLEAPGLVAATLAIILLGKPLAALTIVLVLGYPLRVGLGVAVALAQIGEFSFILASRGKDLGVFSDDATNTLIAAAIVSISVNPALYRLIDVVEARAKRSPAISRWLDRRIRLSPNVDESGRDTSHETSPLYEAIVVGYGPVGRTVVRLLRENNVQPTVIDLNLESVRQLRAQGVTAIYGDATHADALEQAGIKRAVVLILSSSETRGSAEVIRQAREFNAKIRVFARTAYLRDVRELRKAGADVTFAAEGEVALTMTEFILRQLGATAEQIDRERYRIRDELFGGPMSTESLLPIQPNDSPTEGDTVL